MSDTRTKDQLIEENQTLRNQITQITLEMRQRLAINEKRAQLDAAALSDERTKLAAALLEIDRMAQIFAELEGVGPAGSDEVDGGADVVPLHPSQQA